MAHPRPSSPSTNDMYHGLQQIAQHNAATPARQRLRDGDVGIHALSPRSQYNSTLLMQPTASPQMLPPYHQIQEHSSYPEIGDFPGANSAIQYSGYGAPPTAYYPTENLPHLEVLHRTEVCESKPATSSFTPSELVRRTRSGRTLVRPNSPQASRNDSSTSRVTKSPKVKTPKQKAVLAKTPKIEKPLSELTKDMIHIPVRDIEAWVTRPATDRQKEVEKRNGYVTRPMNSFMLYRSAYAERTKAWCVQNNHQVVSSVSGESWPLESAELREQYNEYARIERENHAIAHPDYKFQPSKGGLSSPPRRKRPDDFVDDDDEDEDVHGGYSDSERSDSEWKPRSERSTRRNTQGSSVKRQALKSSMPHPSGYVESPLQQQLQPRMVMAPHYEYDALMVDLQHASYGTSEPSTELYANGHYFPSTLLSSSTSSSLSQAHMPYYIPSTFAVDMSSYHPELLRFYSHTGTPMQMPMGMPMHYNQLHEAQVDPRLLQLNHHNTMPFDGSGEGVAMPTGDGIGGHWAGDIHESGGGHMEEWMTSRDSV